MIESLLARWGYLAVGLGTMIEGEAVLIAAGAFAHRGLLSLPLVIAAAFAGSVLSDQLWFQVGQRFGRPYLERKESWRRRAQKIEPWLHRYGNGFVVGFRFALGFRTITPVVLGATGYPRARFLALNMLGAALWACAFGAAGWALGASIAHLLARAGRIEELAAAAVVVTLGLRALHRLLQSRSR